MSGVEIGLVSLIAGQGLNFAGNIAAANSRADAAAAEAILKNEQADELLSRQNINEVIMRDQARQAEGSFATAFSASGKGGGGIGGQLQIRRDLQRNLDITRREAEFKANQLRKGANIEQELASSGLAAAWLGGIGSLVGTGVTAYSLMKSPVTADPNGRIKVTDSQWKPGFTPNRSSNYSNGLSGFLSSSHPIGDSNWGSKY